MSKYKYLKIKVEFLYATKRFYRLFYVRSGTYLSSFIDIVLFTLRCGMDHLYDLKTETPMENEYEVAFVDDLPFKSLLTYDYGDNWRFLVTRYKNEKELDETRKYILVEAKGRGIWEDFIGYFYDFLDNKYNDESEIDDDYSPLPYDYSKPSDFDKPIDIDELNELINKNELNFNWW